jgi:Tol biopolymer transport system component
MAVYSVPALGGDETRIAPGIAYSLSSGGEWLLLSRASDTNGFRSTSGVLIRQMSTGQERMLVRNSGEFDEFGFQFSPDEKWVYFSRRRIGTPAVAMRVPFAGGDVQQVKIPELEGSLAVIEAVQFFGRNTGMRVMGFDKNGARRGYLMKPDGTRVIALPSNVPTSAGVSPDGRRIIVSVAFGIGPLYRVPAFPDRGEKVVPVKVLDSPRWEASPQFSPDGSRIAVSSGRSGSSMLWLWNAALTEGKPIFEKPSQTTGSPSWSPDGRSIAFDARVKTSQPDIWVAPADGGPARQLTDAPGEDSVPCFDRTGQWIYFTTDREGGMRLYRVPVGGGAQTPVSTRGGFSCQFSPDGKHVYYLQSRSGGELWRHEIATGKEEPVLPAYKNRNFKVLSDGIYLLEIGVASQNTMPATPGAAMFYRFATKKIEKLGFATTKPVGNNGIDLSPDRKWLYYSQVDARASDLQLIENLPF